MNLLFLAVIVLFILNIWIGYKRGFLKIVTSLATTVVTLILVLLISPTVSKFLLSTFPIESAVEKRCEKMFAEEDDEEQTRDEEIMSIENSAMPGMLQNKLIDNNNKETKQALGVTGFKGYIVKSLSKIFAKILAFLISFLVVGILVRLLLRTFNVVSKVPVLGKVNGVLGGVSGFAFALVILWLVFIFITLFCQTRFATVCFESIEQNFLLKWLYNNNLLLKFII